MATPQKLRPQEVELTWECALPGCPHSGEGLAQLCSCWRQGRSDGVGGTQGHILGPAPWVSGRPGMTSSFSRCYPWCYWGVGRLSLLPTPEWGVVGDWKNLNFLLKPSKPLGVWDVLGGCQVGG